MSKTVVFAVPGDLEARTGGYEYDRQLIEGLRQRGWTVSVIHLGEGYPLPSAELRSQAGAEFAAIPDGTLVVVDGLALGALPDEAAAEAERLRLVGLVHHPLGLETGLAPDTAAQLFDSERRALTAVRTVVVTSRQTADTMLEQALVAARPSVVVPGTKRRDLATGSGGSDIRLLCVASIVARKGHAVLVEALASLAAQPWTLVCAGSLDRDEVAVAAVQALVHEHDLGDRVKFAGELSEEELHAEYARADLFVLPTLYEGYGMVVAEAVAHGLPVIASDTGGVADILCGSAGIVVPPGDVDALRRALLTVISHRETRQRLVAGARLVREYLPSWEGSAAVMEDVLLEVRSA